MAGLLDLNIPSRVRWIVHEFKVLLVVGALVRMGGKGYGIA
jgi:hypothetical protein